MATKTTNERLGIIGGISILGTTGIVKPFSTASYRASVVQQIDVAAAQGHDLVVLATGSRSEAYALAAWPDLPPVCVVEVGDFTGIALRRAAGAGMHRAVFVGMVGKITKLAAGVMMTHFHRSQVDTELLAEVARATGAPPAGSSKPPRRRPRPATSSRCAWPKAFSNRCTSCAAGRLPTAGPMSAAPSTSKSTSSTSTATREIARS